ncbi:MAG TPA: bifunctional methylenetetrahydrofolate dehydrogenase/methenyltetrahydrofolate cyclohydrolase FolD [Gemmatimonadaceae bacterium]|nr:bifunctional methylenetetrahydrofolate dehydrogenase/methenyltetrahydrofolate cyclohydrolase FolD [Gemmatimonadaceae bacterium]
MRAEVTATVIDGKEVARRVRDRVAEEVKVLKARGVTPGLTVVLVGDDPASTVYVASKGKACADAGMKGDTIRLPASTAQPELLRIVDRLNRDASVHGILVQMPLPKQIDAEAVVRAIDPAKDVDGFHPVNVGRLFIGDADAFAPCTPAGVMVLLREYGIPTAGANVVIIGRSMIVGKPMAALLVQPGVDATVTICHSRTRDLADHTRRADILIAAVGRPEMVTGDMIKPGGAVIDVGINRVDDPTSAKGYRLVGDVHFDSARHVASHITPVPGGVGAMTIAMLMDNTLKAATRIAGIRAS